RSTGISASKRGGERRAAIRSATAEGEGVESDKTTARAKGSIPTPARCGKVSVWPDRRSRSERLQIEHHERGDDALAGVRGHPLGRYLLEVENRREAQTHRHRVEFVADRPPVAAAQVDLECETGEVAGEAGVDVGQELHHR